MKDQIASGIVIVRVHMTDNLVGGKPVVQLWAVALPRDEAVEAVKSKIPANWTTELTDQRPTQELVRRLRMKLGSACEISSAL